FNIVVVPPAPDPAKTTRQLYAVHATDAKCAACHDSIDAMGFAFENFDGEGKRRTIDNGHAVDTTTTVSAIADIAGNYADSAQLVSKLASSSVVRECFARYMFRYAAARSGSNSAKNPNDAAERAAEGAFVAAWNALPADRQDSLVEVLVAYAGTPAFVTRQVMQ
ncbi:MAG: DUF1588 domain-containing protein, partial [Myxococcota bacterium]|nr:DUF1588 domain-containing protein [Myxococcota bacterium]